MRSRAFTFILITAAVDGASGAIIFPLLPLLLMDLTGSSVTKAAIYGGWISTLFCVMQVIATPILGNLSDRYGRKPILLGSLLAFAVNYLIIGSAPSLAWLFVGAALAGGFSATISTANAFIADVTPPEERAKRFGLVTAASVTGFVIGPLLIGLLQPYGSHMPFFVAGTLAVVNAINGFFILPESLPAESRRPFSWARANPLGMLLWAHKRTDVRRMLGTFALLKIAEVTPPVIWGYYTIYKFGWSQREIALSISFSALAAIVVQAFIIGRLTHRLGALRTANIGFGFLILSLIGYAFAGSGWMILLFIVPSALGTLASIALISHLSAQVGASSQGEAQGAIASTASAAIAVTPMMMTSLFHYFSSPNPLVVFPGVPFLLAMLIAVVGLSLAISLRKPQRLPEPVAQGALTFLPSRKSR